MKRIFTRSGLLVGLSLLGAVNAFAGNTTFYSKVKATVSPTGAGLVYVGTSANAPTDAPFKDAYEAKQSTETKTEDKVKKVDHTYYFFAKNLDENSYLWDGWYQGDTKASDDIPYMVKGSTSSTKENEPALFADLTAKWLQPTVLSVERTDLGVVTDPTDTIEHDVAFNVSEAVFGSNFTGILTSTAGFSFMPPVLDVAKQIYYAPITYTPQNIHGAYTTDFSLSSKYNDSGITATLQVKEDYTPDFDFDIFDFGNVPTMAIPLLNKSPKEMNYAASNAIWTAWIEGTDKDFFSLAGSGQEGKAHPIKGEIQVAFSPQEARSYTATLHINAVYTDAVGNQLTETKQIPLSGTAQLPTGAQLVLNAVKTNEGTYDVSGAAPLYTYLPQYGTVTKQADFSIGYANTDKPTYTWSGNDAGIFTVQEGTAEAGTLPLTISAKAPTAVTAETTYTAALTISAKSTVAADNSKELTQTLQLSVTIHPKHKNTLAWGLTPWSNNSFRYIFTDDKPVYALSSINNMDTIACPIEITCTTKGYEAYFSIDNVHHTIAPIAMRETNMALKATQPASDEYEGASITTNFQVRRHALEYVYPGGSGVYLYKNTYYPHVISTTAEQAGEAKITASYYDDGERSKLPEMKDGLLRQRLFQNTDGTWGMQTGDTITPRRVVDTDGKTQKQYLKILVQQEATAHYAGTSATSNVQFQIIKDPIHVPVSPSLSVNATTGVKTGLWNNNHSQQDGTLYRVESYQAEWIGYDWQNKDGVWSGKWTGRTDWTTVKKQGSGNAFVLYDGGYVIFRFRGVPMYTNLSMWFHTATSDGTLTIEESPDGRVWTKIDKPITYTKDDYWQTPGGKSGWMKSTSRYIRYSYSGANHIVLSTGVQENTYVRTHFAAQNTTKEVKNDTTIYREIGQNADGTWNPFTFTLSAANWRGKGVEWRSSNPDFAVEWDEKAFAQDGLDQWKETPARVVYKGTVPYATSLITLYMREFYGKTSTDSLRAYTFKVTAAGGAKAMPQTITNATKTTTYYTGTVGPIVNKKRNLDDTYTPYGDLQSTDRSYSQGNFDPRTGLRAHNFVNCFGEDGMPLFDQLYIFGTTTNNDGTYETITSYYENEQGDTLMVKGSYPKISESNNTVGSNAITPMYIYKKNGNQYDLERTIPNTNVATPQVILSATGQRVYFSGHCPHLSTGHKKDENGGAIFVSGGAGSRIDLYFEDCVVRSRTHSEKGHNIGNGDLENVETYEGKYPKSTGSTLVFMCTGDNNASNPFKPFVHFRGENRFRSTTGQPKFKYIKNVTRSCSPVEVLMTSDKSCTEITFDDVWAKSYTDKQGARTNGFFRLSKGGGSNCPSIDLGNANTILNFAGGRITLQNSIPGSDKYTNTLAISYRIYTGDYGLGSDLDGGTVNFLDGTVNAIPQYTMNSAQGDVSSYFIYQETNSEGETYTMGLDTVITSKGAKRYYATSLRTPKNTFVKGGSHNAPIRAVTKAAGKPADEGAATSVGNAPTDGDPNPQPVGRYDIQIPAEDIDENGFAKFEFPNDLGNPTTGQSLKDYYKENNKSYGLESMAPDQNGEVHLWLPLAWLGRVEDTSLPKQWIECLTDIVVDIPDPESLAFKEQTIGGDKEIDTERMNLNLMYVVIDQNIRQLIADKYSLPVKNPISGGYQTRAAKSIGDGVQRDITNTGDYKIENKLYYIHVAHADTWTTFAAPFDVKKIYVLDAYPDSIYAKKVNEDKSLTRAEALVEQAKANADFAGFVGVGIIMGWYGNSMDGFMREFYTFAYGQDTTSGVYPKWMNKKNVNGVSVDYYPTHYASAKRYTTDFRGMHELTNFTGSNYADANYYLYRSKNKTWKYDGTKFETDWEVVTPEADGIILRKGEIYCMQFPYCPGCDDPATRDYWDYWTGKLIIMEGDGPQTISGTDFHQTQFNPYVIEHSASLRGNPTLAKMTVPNHNGAAGYLDNVFFHMDGQRAFTPNQEASLADLPPTGVFLLANPNSRGGAPARAIASIDARTGVISYEQGSEEEMGTPTVSGGHSLIVTVGEQSLTVTPVYPQRVAVYSAAGQLIADQYMSEAETFDLSAGIYMVRGEKEQVKVVLR